MDQGVIFCCFPIWAERRIPHSSLSHERRSFWSFSKPVIFLCWKPSTLRSLAAVVVECSLWLGWSELRTTFPVGCCRLSSKRFRLLSCQELISLWQQSAGAGVSRQYFLASISGHLPHIYRFSNFPALWMFNEVVILEGRINQVTKSPKWVLLIFQRSSIVIYSSKKERSQVSVIGVDL